MTLLKNHPGTLLFLLLVNLSAGRLTAQPPLRMIDRFPELVRTEGASRGPLFTVRINSSLISSSEFVPDSGESFFHPYLSVRAGIEESPAAAGYRCRFIRIMNESPDTLEVEDLIPLGASPDRPYITAYGPPGLARATLFRPGHGPVGLIVPDNAWELGFTTLDCPPDSGIALLARRDQWEQARRSRYSTLLFPGGEVRYRLYTELYRGNWKDGWMHVFRDRWLYDLEQFDNRLYERPDLQWIRQDYLAVLQFAWDTDFYSREQASYAPFREFFHRYDALHGGYDIYGIWQGWPRLGLDPRNQWDLFRDLPGGTDSIRHLAQYCRENQSAFFISYNPWDESTRPVNHLEAISNLVLETGADGMVLDTRGSSSLELQEAADLAREGVVMYSEGMAVPRDMPGIISGRVHNAILMSPPLNLNRLIKPEFQVFRVLDLRDGRIRREAAICLFNGYGMELNLFSPAHPWWLEEEYRYMGRCLMILRQNQKAFHDLNWVPLEEAADSIWINRWQDGDKIVYTLLSMKPEGHAGPLLAVPPQADRHWVSLWDHEEVLPEPAPEGPRLDCTIEPFSPAFTGTRSEGSVQCIAGFPRLLRWEMGRDSLLVEASAGDRILLWKGNPSYSNTSRTERLLDENRCICEPLSSWMHQPEGKIVIQLMDGTEILDERVIRTSMATPVRITQTRATAARESCPEGMVEIKGGSYLFYRGNDADFIPYPHNFDTLALVLPDYYMDRYPVTNREFREFLLASGYSPPDTTNFLKHWKGGSYPDSLADHPVVWVSRDDARAYAGWKGERLPTEAEWQYAAQGRDGRTWPWGADFDSTLCNNAAGHTTPVHRFPGGRSPFGVEDLTGNVWQMCDEEYSDGTYIFSMIRGGSWYRPTSSWWYIQGGPQPNNRTQMLLRTSPGFDRSATVGFRCVCDQ